MLAVIDVSLTFNPDALLERTYLASALFSYFEIFLVRFAKGHKYTFNFYGNYIKVPDNASILKTKSVLDVDFGYRGSRVEYFNVFVNFVALTEYTYVGY